MFTVGGVGKNVTAIKCKQYICKALDNRRKEVVQLFAIKTNKKQKVLLYYPWQWLISNKVLRQYDHLYLLYALNHFHLFQLNKTSIYYQSPVTMADLIHTKYIGNIIMELM